MGDKKTKTRDQIDQYYKWNIETMYPNEADWDKDYTRAMEEAQVYGKYSGRLGESAATLLEAFQEKDRIWQIAEKVYVYARMRRDEDNRVTKYQAMADKCHTMLAKISACMSFFTPELLDVPKEALLRFIQAENGLKIYEYVILDMLREKEHVLSKAEENLLAQMSEVTSATNDIYTLLNNADMKFGTMIDEDGDEVEVTHGRYISFMESYDRRVRKEAFEHMYGAYKALINTISTTYNYNTKTDVIGARIRKYDSALGAALSSDNIPKEVYHNLIDVVNKNLPILHKYMQLRKELLGVDELHMYDVYVPLIEVPNKKVSYEEALDIMREGLAPLGEDYCGRMNKGIADGWIDVYENEGKTSGAYSFGSYDSMPFILLNYSEKLKDVFTIVHEMGHSMHSNYTRETQPFVYGGHSIFTAEVASTVNESLLMQHLLHKETDINMRKYILNLYIEEFRTTLFRQTMFAEFELMTHEAVERGDVLTAEWLCEEYGKLNKKYFGDAIADDEDIKYEWARIPHFYNAFYVYKYATGYSAATAIADKILKEGPQARDRYISFLRTGESNYPIELLKIAGVDMSKAEPIEMAMKTFEALVNEFESLVR
ncbi:oligoendopeptidase F [Clostridium aminobutyricum]|uniref:Oligopeptidase F n=1 Tax=Clostridium aminobutyricum TaxID=33953 RepID=A0A939D6W3_CLOAM|nr:oligoendopeptidase F [Clostridium aminobutyricum]MBN7772207.1 oligoendopeptidase F [Clostridium aminobutyricum]